MSKNYQKINHSYQTNDDPDEDSGITVDSHESPSDNDVEATSKKDNGKWHVSKDEFKKPDEVKWKDLNTNEKIIKILKNTVMVIGLLTVIFVYICSLSLLCQAFKLLSGREIGHRIRNSKIIRNPISASIVGMIITLVLQSSSTLMSILIGMIGGKLLTVHLAIPIMMGSEMGASIMNALIALTQLGDRNQFRRAFAASTMNDIYNFLCFIILLPIEIMFSPAERLSSLVVSPLSHIKTEKIKTLDYLTDPLLDYIVQIDHHKLQKAALSNDSLYDNSTFVFRCHDQSSNFTSDSHGCEHTHLFSSTTMSDSTIGIILVVIAVSFLVGCMFGIVKILSYLFEGRIAVFLRKILDKKLPYPFKWLTDYIFMFIGAAIVVVIENSSVFRSALTPLVGIGVVTLEQLFPLIIGGNIGTTSTSTLAAFSAAPEELQITLQMAFSQTIFNIFGLLLFYPIPFMRRIPINLAMKLGDKTARYRWFSIVYIITVFILLPLLLLLISLLPPTIMVIILSIITVFLATICLICVLQRKYSKILPRKLQSWNFLPIWLHSLKPYDKFMTNLFHKVMCQGNTEERTEKFTDNIHQTSAAKKLISESSDN